MYQELARGFVKSFENSIHLGVAGFVAGFNHTYFLHISFRRLPI